MDAGILDGKGVLLVPVLTDLLGLAGVASGISPSRPRGRLGASPWTALIHLINRLDKSNVKNFPILDLACLGVGWSPLTSKQIALHIGELEVFFCMLL